jgi:competence protein ComEA
VLLVILVALFVYLAIRYACHPVYVSDPQPDIPARFHDLADRIDPNSADWQTLAALPGIGEKKAKDIIEYRDRTAAERPGKPVFEKLEDLLRIKGIGRAMMTGMEPYLTFPTPSATAPSP